LETYQLIQSHVDHQIILVDKVFCGTHYLSN